MPQDFPAAHGDAARRTGVASEGKRLFQLPPVGRSALRRGSFGLHGTESLLFPPPAPQNLRVTTTGTNQIDLAWDQVAGTTKYAVLYKQRSATAWSTLETTSESASATTLQCETDYEFRVQAFGDGLDYQAEYGTLSSPPVQRRTASC